MRLGVILGLGALSLTVARPALGQAGFTVPAANKTYVTTNSFTLYGGVGDWNNGQFNYVTNVAVYCNDALLGNATLTNPSGGGNWTGVWASVSHGTFTFKTVMTASRVLTTTVSNVTLAPTNRPPVVSDSTVIAPSGGYKEFNATYTELDSGQLMTGIVVNPPSHGLAIWNTTLRRWRYEPTAGYMGPDSFTFKLNDGWDDSNVATANITVTNTPPVANSTRQVVLPNSVTNLVALESFDPDTGQSLSIVLVTPPEHGTVSNLTLESCFYTPAPGYVGEDSFSFRYHDGVADSNLATCRFKVAAVGSRAGHAVLVLVRNSLLPQVSVAVNRLRDDLINEGFTSRVISNAGTGSASNFWATLKSEYESTNQWLNGVILIGNLPTAKVSTSNDDNDLIYWNMREYFTTGNQYRFDIWVSRIHPTTHYGGTDASNVQRALQNNHDYRTGQQRFPHTAYYYNCFSNFAANANHGAALGEVWPAVRTTNEFSVTGYSTAAKFFPERTDLNVAGADALVGGGEIFQETSHGATSTYMNGAFWRADLQRLGSPMRFIMVDSCYSGERGWIANQHLFARLGGTIFAVGATGLSLANVADHQFATLGGNHAVVRARLAQGDWWGEALRSAYPFQDKALTMYHGDLSCGVMMGPSNALPRVTVSANKTNAAPGEAVTFAITVHDPDAGNPDNPALNYAHQVSWYATGVTLTAATPTWTTNDSAASWTNHTFAYPVAGVYTARVEVADEWKAVGWRELVVSVNTLPQPVPDTATTRAGQPVIVPVLGNDTDADGDPLSVVAVTQPASGSVLNHGTNVTYTPTASFTGTTMFAYTVGDGRGGTNSTTVTVTVAATWDQWRASQFSAAELADPLVSGPTADPEGDGVGNLLEYAFRGNPQQGETNLTPRLLPVAGHLTLTYRRRADAGDLTYTVEGRDSLASGGWSAAGIDQDGVSVDHGAYREITVTDPVSMNGATARFLRLRVTYTPE